ncbi:hypothetical protein ACROYT_G028033 [Oculina patagonica]
MNRELAIQFARSPIAEVTFFVPKCTEDDKEEAKRHNVNIVEANTLPGFEPLDWLSFPPENHDIDIIVGHGVKLGKQAQVIRKSHHSTWVQVVHTAPEKLAMFKTYSDAISKGDEKQWTELKLCTIADLVVAVGPKLYGVYSRYLSRSGKNVFNLTPGIFTELSDLKQSTQGSKDFWVLVFGRGDSEDFELKGFDIAAKSVAELNDRSYHLVFVGAPSGNEKQVADKLLEQGLRRSQLTVKGYIKDRDDLATLLSTANLAIIPSRTEGFGLTALEALSAGLPFLVSQNSGFGEALQGIPSGLSWIVDSEDPKQWAEAIKGVREKGIETAVQECQELRTRYAEKYSWEKQCNDLVEVMGSLANCVSVSQNLPLNQMSPINQWNLPYANQATPAPLPEATPALGFGRSVVSQEAHQLNAPGVSVSQNLPLNQMSQINQWNLIHANQPCVPEGTPAPGFERFMVSQEAHQLNAPGDGPI